MFIIFHSYKRSLPDVYKHANCCHHLGKELRSHSFAVGMGMMDARESERAFLYIVDKMCILKVRFMSFAKTHT